MELTEAMRTIGHAICRAEAKEPRSIWLAVMETAREQLALLEAPVEAAAGPGATAAGGVNAAGDAAAVAGGTDAAGSGAVAGSVGSKLQDLFLLTCYDVFRVSECCRSAPWALCDQVGEMRGKALARCRTLKKMLLKSERGAVVRERCDSSLSSTTDASDDAEGGALINILDIPRLAGPRSAVRVEDWPLLRAEEPLPFYGKTDEERERIQRCLTTGTSFVFEAIHERENQLIDALKPVTLMAGQCAIREGDSGDGMYFVGCGSLALIKKGQQVKTLGPGDIFGELGVLHPSTRTYTCTALEDSLVYFLSRPSYQRLIREAQ